MSTHVDSGSHTDRGGHYVPAYGPIDAVLGYVLFYVIVDRATPTVVDVFTGVFPGISPPLVRLGLAAFLWFVLVVTVIDQARRQLAALGGGEDTGRSTLSRVLPTEPQALAYLVLLVVGGLVAVWTFEPAIEMAVSLIRVVASLDLDAFVLGEFVVMVVFFLSFEVATYALDRLLIGGVREMLADGGERERP